MDHQTRQHLGIGVYLHFTFLLLLAFLGFYYWRATQNVEAALRARVRVRSTLHWFWGRVAMENNAGVLTGTVKSERARQRTIRNAHEAGARQVVVRLRIAPYSHCCTG